jgi:phosphoglycerol transferase
MNITHTKEKILTRSLASRWMPYGFVVAFCLGLESLLLGLGWTDLGVPYLYHYDYLYFSASVKGVLEHGWYLNNPNLGAPGTLAAYDYTGASNVDFLIIKCIGLFTSDWAKAMNLFYVVTFPLAAVSALAVFRHFKIPSPVAITGSLLFAFAPYHFLRLLHITYTNYFFVPLVTMVLLWIVNEKLMIVYRDADSGKWRFNVRPGISLASILIAVLVSGSGVYYAFFSCFFLVIAGGMAFLNKRNTGVLFTSWILIGVICAGVALQMVPSWIYKMKHGGNPLVTLFAPMETEKYGMKIAQLLLPVQEHRVPSLAQLRAWYDRTAPLSNENRYAALGLAGSVGFLILLIGLFRRRSDEPLGNLEWPLARLNIGAVLLATVGGFSSLFAYLINSQIRGYNRISIFIEFFAIFALVILLARAYEKLLKARTSRLLSHALCGMILVLGILDQIPTSFKTPYPAIQKQFAEDSAFFTRIERALPEGAMVFQLPYVAFPISQPLNRMGPYDHVRGYLHTRKVRWSYGALNGRGTQAWQQSVSQLPVQGLVDIVAISGFKGVYLNRRGYADGGEDMINRLSEILEAQPWISSGGGEVFFDLEPYIQKLKKQVSADQWEALQQSVLTDPLDYAGKDLFKPSQVIAPGAGFVELVTPRSGGSKQPILVGGWAVDPETRTPAIKLMVVHEGKASQLFVSQQVPRPDIARKYGSETALKSQWSMVLDTRAWTPGKHSFGIYAVLKEGRLGRLGGCEDKCRVTLSSK